MGVDLHFEGEWKVKYCTWRVYNYCTLSCWIPRFITTEVVIFHEAKGWVKYPRSVVINLVFNRRCANNCFIIHLLRKKIGRKKIVYFVSPWKKKSQKKLEREKKSVKKLPGLNSCILIYKVATAKPSYLVCGFLLCPHGFFAIQIRPTARA